MTLSHELGREERALAILGEGNTSALASDKTFWVKASGSQLGTISTAGFTEVHLDAILELTERESVLDLARLRDNLAELQRAGVRIAAASAAAGGWCVHELALDPSVDADGACEAVARALGAAGIALRRLERTEPALEAVFHRLIAGAGARP